MVNKQDLSFALKLQDYTTTFSFISMPSHAQFTVNLVVNDATLDEYEVTRKDSVYSCWVASEVGKVSMFYTI